MRRGIWGSPPDSPPRFVRSGATAAFTRVFSSGAGDATVESGEVLGRLRARVEAERSGLAELILDP